MRITECKVGERAAMYSYRGRELGTIHSVGGMVNLTMDNGGAFVCHPKQLRRLVKKPAERKPDFEDVVEWCDHNGVIFPITSSKYLTKLNGQTGVLKFWSDKS